MVSVRFLLRYEFSANVGVSRLSARLVQSAGRNESRKLALRVLSQHPQQLIQEILLPIMLACRAQYLPGRERYSIFETAHSQMLVLWYTTILNLNLCHDQPVTPVSDAISVGQKIEGVVVTTPSKAHSDGAVYAGQLLPKGLGFPIRTPRLESSSISQFR